MRTRLYLVHLSEGVILAKYALPDGETSVGRSPRSQILLSDWSVSRQHARLSNTNGSVTVRDLNSKNGTFINDRQVQLSPLLTRQQIRFGEFRMVLLPEGDLLNDSGSELETSDPRSSGTAGLQRPSLPLDQLTSAQRPVLKLLLEGLSEREIAEHIDLSPHTVHNHARAIYRKLCIHKKSELFRHLLPRVDQTVILRREDIDAQ